MANSQLLTGLERCRDHLPASLQSGNYGLLMNQASVDRDWNYAVDVLRESSPAKLCALFSPQHGIWGEEQANMIETEHFRESPWGVPLYSLYSETRMPTDEMLAAIDTLVIDLQDVGTRVYTYAWTVVNCLKACARNQKTVLILDRPNPLGGQIVEGPVLQREFESFVGMLPIPMRHALTLGEIARMARVELQLDVDLQILDVVGWKREQMFDQTGLPWTAPSPNLPRWESSLFYPGMVLLEGTNLSEGRGTTTPFQLLGAPFIDPFALDEELKSLEPAGVRLRPVRFRPTFDKWKDQSCGGIAFEGVEPSEVRSYQLIVEILMAIKRLWPSSFEWLPPPYEYERQRMPIDILSGSEELRLRIDGLPNSS